jgi:hypothetical protein
VFLRGEAKNAALSTFFVRQNLVMETGAGSISLRVESNDPRLEEVQPAQFWDDATYLFSLAEPPMPAIEDSFVPVKFR